MLQVILLLSVFSTVLLLLYLRTTTPTVQFWSKLPSVDRHERTWFSRAGAILRSVTHSAVTASKGYDIHSKNGMPFVVPSTGCGAVVVVPPSQFHVFNKPESDVQAYKAQMESHQPRYTMDDQEVYADMIHFDVVRSHFTRKLGSFVGITDEELGAAFHDQLGQPESWDTIDVWDLCTRVIARVGNRVYIGSPLCHDETFLEQSRQYATAVYSSAAIITAMPPFLRPWLGHLVAIPAKRSLSRCRDFLVPIVQERLMTIDEDSEHHKDDALQWLILRCQKAGPEQLDAWKIAQRLLILNLVSIYTTAYALANCIVDTYGSPSAKGYITDIRAECDRVSTQYSGGLSNKRAIDDLVRIDSTIRESMRVSAFGIIAMFRDIPEGKDLKLSNGTQIPGGARIAMPCQPIHLDESRYKNAREFDAFRFSRPFEAKTHQQKSSVDWDESFLTYGYGKHVCPGRWFASQMMKQALACLVQNYDVEYVDNSHKKKVLLNMVLPPVSARMRVRRRM